MINKKIVSLFGSPNDYGTSSSMHVDFLQNCANYKIDKYFAYKMNIAPCRACGKCESSECFYSDDVTGFIRSFCDSDLIVFSWPVYFSSAPGNVKCIIDRFQVLWEEVQRGNYKGRCKELVYFFSAGAEYPNVFEPSKTIVKYFSNTFNLKIRDDLSGVVSGTDKKKSKK